MNNIFQCKRTNDMKRHVKCVNNMLILKYQYNPVVLYFVHDNLSCLWVRLVKVYFRSGEIDRTDKIYSKYASIRVSSRTM